ncbi:MAG: serine/threonine protein kinase, partial [Planctomycetes bacterium]|nr:serine/threonine protein kinase [Planctomycetota bacterium]
MSPLLEAGKVGPRGGSLCTNISLGLVVNLPQNIGPYQVVRLLGQGGMGVVYEVVHSRQPGKRLALKLILADEPPPDVLTRFQREAELLAKVSHPNIVGVLDFASDAGRPYMVFDYVAGEDLRSLCSASPMDPQQVARIGRDLAAALDLLHRRGIIHRDLKPENVILRPDGSPVLLDFGLARELDAERLTVTGTILGTPSFMAPEQANGLTDLDGRTDVYGLGAILFFLLLGRPPFRGTTPMGILRQVLMEEP